MQSMYGSAKGLKPNREAIWGAPIGTNPLAPQEDGPPLSGLHAPGNSLTSAGPTTEPMGVNDLDAQKRKMAMLLAGRALSGMGQGMRQGGPAPGLMGLAPPQQSFVDMFGNPVR